MIIELNENIKINDSLQVGDILYYAPLNGAGPISNSLNDPIIIGEVTSISGSTITTVETPATPQQGDFLMFVKNNKVNTSGLKGYYARVKLELDSDNKGKLFSVSAEVAESSK